LTIFILSYCAYALIFIWNTSFVIEGERYFTLFEDTMISMRFARNFAFGYGLVWNVDDTPIEGFTNGLWVFFLAGVHLLPLPLSKLGLVVQLTGVIAVIITAYLVSKLAGLLSDNSVPVILSSAFLTLFSLDLNYWSLLGLEVGLLVLTVTGSAYLVARDLGKNHSSSSALLLLAFACLVRLDMAITYL